MTGHRTNLTARSALCTLCLLLALPWPGSADDTDAMHRKQQAQEKIRVLARELVSGILDIQVRQLQENGLTQLPIYDEIQSMQVHIDALVDGQMVDVVQLLVMAQQGTRDQRLAYFDQARVKIRDLVVQLMAQRQKLLRRMQVARLTAQVRQLIDLQMRALTATDLLPAQSLANRDQTVLDAVQDQRDVESMFLVLVQTLADVSSWGGQIAAGASDGLQILKAAKVGLELDRAEEFLEGGVFGDAAASQKAVIKGLRALLERIEQTRGLISSDRQFALKLVRDLIEDQERLRDAVQQAQQPTPAKTEQLVADQAEIHKSLGKLAEMLDHSPAAQPLLEQAKASAYEATAQLFEENKTAVVAEQSRIIGSLAEIEEQLRHEIASQRDDKSSAGSRAQASATGQQESDPAATPAAPAPPGDMAATADAANTQSDVSQTSGSEPNSDTDNRTADGNSDADVRSRMFRDEPWFAKLPPSLRNAIEARARRPAPRGYEERLRRYFESVD